MIVTPSSPGYAPVTPVFGEGVTAQPSGTLHLFSIVTPVTPELRTYKGDSRGEDGAHGAGTHTRPPSREIGRNGCNGVTGVTGTQPSGAPGWLAWTARTALPTHDPASVPSAASPEPPGCLCAPPAAVPSTTDAGGTVVTRSPRLPSVAECAELLAAGWTPLLGRLGVWADDSGDSRAMWWTWALEIARRDRSRAGADGGGGACHDAPGRAILAAMAEGATE